MPLLDIFWSMAVFFVWLGWLWVLIQVVLDIFRSNDLSGLAKALWILFIVLVPFIGVFVYLVARGGFTQGRTRNDIYDQGTFTGDAQVGSRTTVGL